jgi:hypothetical protein
VLCNRIRPAGPRLDAVFKAPRCRSVGEPVEERAPRGSKNGNYKHGRYTQEVAATRRWIHEAIHTLRDLKKRPE